MEMPKPNEHHRRLERLAGRWTGQETMYPSPWDPDGGTATGRNDMRIALDGFALITDYEQERNGVITFRGHGVMTYDGRNQHYVLYWLDSMGSPLEVFTGNFDGDVLTVEHGGPMHARLVYDLTQPGILRSSMEMSQDGEKWGTFFTCDYARG
jgi:hypothetical protein